MNSLQFRAIVTDPGKKDQERPVQIFGSSREEVERWAELQLQAAISNAAWVDIYQTREELVARKFRPTPEVK